MKKSRTFKKRMLVIEMPPKNKLQFVYDLLHKFISSFEKHSFINCTQSPIQELSYIKGNGLYYRKIGNENVFDFIDEDNYIESYELDQIYKQGLDLKEYIIECLFFELEEILVIKESDIEKINTENKLKPLAKVIICPDGFREIHIEGDESILNRFVSVINSYDSYSFIEKQI